MAHNPGRVKRLAKEYMLLEKSCIHERGIFFKPCDDNLQKAYALIVGPRDTPYFGGAFFFEFQFTDRYPFEPPVVKTLTQDGKTRFNPNLYVNGKVCLSMLNTWQGDQWSPSLSIEAILNSIQAMVLHAHPLVNEPGYSGVQLTDQRAQEYNAIVAHATLETGIIHVLEDENTFGAPLSFLPQYKEYVLPLLGDLIKYYESYAKYDAQVLECVYRRVCLMRFAELIQSLTQLLTPSKNAG
jgi:ubiquitin-protein ligase